jgi:DNA polymerase elongation subunit (family B)
MIVATFPCFAAFSVILHVHTRFSACTIVSVLLFVFCLPYFFLFSFCSERALLSLLTAKIHSIDPDVIVGHDLHGFGVDVLLSRMAHYKMSPHWSKLGRIRKQK